MDNNQQIEKIKSGEILDNEKLQDNKSVQSIIKSDGIDNYIPNDEMYSDHKRRHSVYVSTDMAGQELERREKRGEVDHELLTALGTWDSKFDIDEKKQVKEKMKELEEQAEKREREEREKENTSFSNVIKLISDVREEIGANNMKHIPSKTLLAGEYGNEYKYRLTDIKRAEKQKNKRSRLYQKEKNAKTLERVSDVMLAGQLRKLSELQTVEQKQISTDDFYDLAMFMGYDRKKDQRLVNAFMGKNMAQEGKDLNVAMEIMLKTIMGINVSTLRLDDDKMLVQESVKLEWLSNMLPAFYRLANNTGYFKRLTKKNQELLHEKLAPLESIAAYYMIRKDIITDPLYRTHYNDELSMNTNNIPDENRRERRKKIALAEKLQRSYIFGIDMMEKNGVSAKEINKRRLRNEGNVIGKAKYIPDHDMYHGFLQEKYMGAWDRNRERTTLEWDKSAASVNTEEREKRIMHKLIENMENYEGDPLLQKGYEDKPYDQKALKGYVKEFMNLRIENIKAYSVTGLIYHYTSNMQLCDTAHILRHEISRGIMHGAKIDDKTLLEINAKADFFEMIKKISQHITLKLLDNEHSKYAAYTEKEWGEAIKKEINIEGSDAVKAFIPGAMTVNAYMEICREKWKTRYRDRENTIKKVWKFTAPDGANQKISSKELKKRKDQFLANGLVISSLHSEAALNQSGRCAILADIRKGQLKEGKDLRQGKETQEDKKVEENLIPVRRRTEYNVLNGMGTKEAVALYKKMQGSIQDKLEADMQIVDRFIKKPLTYFYAAENGKWFDDYSQKVNMMHVLLNFNDYADFIGRHLKDAKEKNEKLSVPPGYSSFEEIIDRTCILTECMRPLTLRHCKMGELYPDQVYAAFPLEEFTNRRESSNTARDRLADQINVNEEEDIKDRDLDSINKIHKMFDLLLKVDPNAKNKLSYNETVNYDMVSALMQKEADDYYQKKNKNDWKKLKNMTLWDVDYERSRFMRSKIPDQRQYLDDKIQRLLNIKLSPEMFKPSYLVANWNRMSLIRKELNDYNFVVSKDPSSSCYVDGMPKNIKARLDELMMKALPLLDVCKKVVDTIDRDNIKNYDVLNPIMDSISKRLSTEEGKYLHVYDVNSGRVANPDTQFISNRMEKGMPAGTIVFKEKNYQDILDMLNSLTMNFYIFKDMRKPALDLKTEIKNSKSGLSVNDELLKNVEVSDESFVVKSEKRKQDWMGRCFEKLQKSEQSPELQGEYQNLQIYFDRINFYGRRNEKIRTLLDQDSKKTPLEIESLEMEYDRNLTVLAESQKMFEEGHKRLSQKLSLKPVEYEAPGQETEEQYQNKIKCFKQQQKNRFRGFFDNKKGFESGDKARELAELENKIDKYAEVIYEHHQFKSASSRDRMITSTESRMFNSLLGNSVDLDRNFFGILFKPVYRMANGEPATEEDYRSEQNNRKVLKALKDYLKAVGGNPKIEHDEIKQRKYKSDTDNNDYEKSADLKTASEAYEILKNTYKQYWYDLYKTTENIDIMAYNDSLILKQPRKTQQQAARGLFFSNLIKSEFDVMKDAVAELKQEQGGDTVPEKAQKKAANLQEKPLTPWNWLSKRMDCNEYDPLEKLIYGYCEYNFVKNAYDERFPRKKAYNKYVLDANETSVSVALEQMKKVEKEIGSKPELILRTSNQKSMK